MSRYFSNGTEGFAWMANWCDRCANDHTTHSANPTSEDYQNACPLISLSMIAPDEIIPEWVDNSAVDGFTLPPAIHCINFRRCQCDNGPDDPGEEPPTPVDPNQGVMFDADVLAPGVPRAVWLEVMEPVGREA